MLNYGSPLIEGSLTYISFLLISLPNECFSARRFILFQETLRDLNINVASFGGSEGIWVGGVTYVIIDSKGTESVAG